MRVLFCSARAPGPSFWLGLLAIAVVGGPWPVAAQEASSAVEADFQSRSTASARLASGGGTIAQAYESMDLSLPVAGSETNGLGVDLIAQRFQFRFGDFAGFLSGRSAPLANASVFTLQPNLILTPAAHWALLGSGLIQYAGADQASTHGSTLGGASIAVADQASTTLRLGLGVEVEQRLKASALVLPFPIIDWHITDQWSLTSLDGESGRLAYAFSHAWSAFGQLEFLSQDLRLGRSSSLSSGVMRYEAYPLSFGVQWQPRPHLSLALSGGEALGQDYRFEDKNGRLLRASSTQSPGLGTLEIIYGF
jgi:hypothetical protein